MSLVVSVLFACAVLYCLVAFGFGAAIIVGLVGGIVAIRLANAERRRG